MAKIMRIVVHVPDVRDVLLLQIAVDALAETDEAIFATSGNPEEFELLRGACGIGHQLRRGLGIRRGGESSNPGKGIQVSEAKVQ